ncbi:hypothetical protein LDENG_00044710 [Lucifuga dentata]|nr:hypothetical protein LDENG_00044710 [Lucifuga dentata]
METSYSLCYFSDLEQHNAEIAAFHLDSGEYSYSCSTEHAVRSSHGPEGLHGRPAAGRFCGVLQILEVSMETLSATPSWQTGRRIQDLSTVKNTPPPYSKGSRHRYGHTGLLMSRFRFTEQLKFLRHHGNETSPWLRRNVFTADWKDWFCGIRREAADGFHTANSGMFAAPSEETSGTSDRDRAKLRSKKRQKVSSARHVTFPKLFPQPPSLSAANENRPFSRPSILQNLPPDSPGSAVELPPLPAQATPEKAAGEAKRTEGARLRSSASGADIVSAADVLVDDSAAQSLSESIKTTSKNKKMKSGKDRRERDPHEAPPITAEDVAEILSKKRDGEVELYYLTQVDGDLYRPYDLRVVHPSQAGSQHYVFTPDAVQHVTDGVCGERISLAEWRRESVLWKKLQDVPFFRGFRLRKAFTWWHRNVRKVSFQQAGEDLQDTLPEFRNALFLFNRAIEEVKETRWLPQDESQTYTLLEFNSELTAINQECLQTLIRLFQHHSLILNTVKEDSYKMLQELQMHIEYCKKSHECNKPLHFHLVQQQALEAELLQAESSAKKLGDFSALCCQMIVQSLATIVQEDVTSFLNNVLKRRKSQRCLFSTELVISAAGQLTVDPPIPVFQAAVSKALLTVGDSMIQMCDSCGFFLDPGSDVSTSEPAQESDHHHTITGQNREDDGMTAHRGVFGRRTLRDEVPCWLQPPRFSAFVVQGHRLHGCFSPLSRKQLQQHISIKDVSEQAEKEQSKIMQARRLFQNKTPPKLSAMFLTVVADSDL